MQGEKNSRKNSRNILNKIGKKFQKREGGEGEGDKGQREEYVKNTTYRRRIYVDDMPEIQVVQVQRPWQPEMCAERRELKR